MTHRDRLVVLSFMNSPYQNTSNDDQNDVKDSLQIETFHTDMFDESDYFDTHEKLEAELAAPTSITSSNPQKPAHSSNALPSGTVSTDESKQNENVNKRNRSKNRNNNASASRKNHDAPMRKSNRKNADDAGKANRNFELNQSRGDAGAPDENSSGKLSKKLPDPPTEGGSTDSSTSNRKTATKNSSIHVVKPVDGFVPSTPLSTDSKIIEIKPSAGRATKKTKRSLDDMLGDVERIRTSIVGDSDEDDGVPAPRLRIETFDNSETIPFFDDQARAAPLIGPAPLNVTTTAPATHLNGVAAYLHKYLVANKEIGSYAKSSRFRASARIESRAPCINQPPLFVFRSAGDAKHWTDSTSFEFLNFVAALAVWSARYPSVFWSTSKPFAAIFSIQMIANAIDIVLGYAGVSVIYKLRVVGRQLPLQVSWKFYEPKQWGEVDK